MTIRFAAIHQGDRKTLAIDPRTGRMRLLENGKEVDYRVEGLAEVAARGQGKITFVGPPATAKGLSQTVASLDVEGDRLTMRQESRPFGEPPRVDEIRLERSR